MIETILDAMCMSGDARGIQRIQTAHRLRLIEFWNIRPGSRVWEIGCGQGDTLAALAYAVGEDGRVLGTDIAGEDYGSPETLGQARARLLSGAFGGRMEIRLNADAAQLAAPPGGEHFDCAVLSHCLWYFADAETLTGLLAHIRPWADRLCMAEWDPRVTAPSQLVHLRAAQLQAAAAAWHPAYRGNIRTMLYPAQIRAAAEAAGWRVTAESAVHSPELQDARWERETALAEVPPMLAQAAGMPPKLRDLLTAELTLLRDAEPHSITAMPVYALCAE